VNGLLLKDITADAISEALMHCVQHPQALRQWSTASEIIATGDSPFTLDAVGRKLTALFP
jgi:hypothetical protein